MNAICAGFAQPPKMCKRLLEDQNIEADVAEGTVYFDEGYAPHHVIGLAVVYFLLVLVFLCLYRRHAKR